MPLPPPPIAYLPYRKLLRDALDRVPSHTPEWTNLNDADPGVTLVQLFAYLTETLSYRANLIPDRNRIKFLDLLGIQLRPATAAQGLVAFTNPRGPVMQLERDSEVMAGKVKFRTKYALSLLPVEGRLYTKSELDETRSTEAEMIYKRLYEDLDAAGETFGYYEALPFDPPVTGPTLPSIDLSTTVDGALWLALLAPEGTTVAQTRKDLANQVLTLAVLPALDETAKELPPNGADDESSGKGLLFHVPQKSGEEEVRYVPLEARQSADLSRQPGTVELTLPGESGLRGVEDLEPLEPGLGNLPPSLAETEDHKRLITFIRITPAEGSSRISGIWVNGAEISQRAWAQSETLPVGRGEPHQTAVLTHRPVLEDTLTLAVNGELWEPVTDLYKAGPEIEPGIQRLGAGSEPPPPSAPKVSNSSNAYTVDPESGIIRFGDGFHGARPPRGATIIASYAYGGGREGVVGIGAINKGSGLPAGVKVSNPAPTWGGDEAESVNDAEYRIPRWLKHRDRLVAADDFAEIVWSTPGADLGRAEVLSLYDPQLGDVPAHGSVTLLLIPLYDAEHPEHPEPDRLFLEAVCNYLEPRRLITTELHLRGPDYKDLYVSMGVEVVAGQEQGPVLDRVEVEVKRFLSPLAGGFNGTGWSLKKTVEPGEVLAAAARVPGVAKVNGVLLGNGDGGDIPSLEITELQLPRLVGLSVSVGEPSPLRDLLGMEPDGETVQQTHRRLPVPVIPEEC